MPPPFSLPTDGTPMGSTHGARKARPLSPHLQAWRFTVTMAASITQRATGIANMTGTLLLALWAIMAARGEAAFAPVAALLASPLGMIVIGGYVWSLCFHLLGGLRYLVADTGRGLAPAVARKASWGVYIGSVVLAGLVAAAGLVVRAGQ